MQQANLKRLDQLHWKLILNKIVQQQKVRCCPTSGKDLVIVYPHPLPRKRYIFMNSLRYRLGVRALVRDGKTKLGVFRQSGLAVTLFVGWRGGGGGGVIA